LSVKILLKPSEYHDSVSLMQVGSELARLPGVQDAAVVMATEANLGILREAGLLTDEASFAGANDLLIAVKGDAAVLDGALAQAEKLLKRKAASAGEGGELRPRTLRAAMKSRPEANLAVISVAGRYAAAEAWEALRGGVHVLLFSDNVSLEDEVALKQYAVAHGLLLMGPGAGTALINGVALGFANALPAGPVGVVSAAGTGLQEVTCLLRRYGVGITQGIGTGGRDVKEAVGGLMMLAGLQALQADPATQVILLVSKPPAPPVAARVLEQAAAGSKPVVVCFLGAPPIDPATLWPRLTQAHTLEEAALQAARLADATIPAIDELLKQQERRQNIKVGALAAAPAPGQKYLRGLYSGGTLCYETQVIWRQHNRLPLYSNAPLDENERLADSNRSVHHTVVDLGEEEFTVGRPHPMIDNSLRVRRLLQEAADPETAILLLDVVLGYGAHPDPAAELGPAIRQARQAAAEAGRTLIVIGSVTGTPEDPQSSHRQAEAMERAGTIVCESNAAAARMALKVLEMHRSEA
jgi:succinyl-CoA synthetase alpha subunit